MVQTLISGLFLAALGAAAAVERRSPICTAACAAVPADLTLVNQTSILPDPFTFVDGTPVKTKADWTCRAEQIRELFQRYELGYKPPRPDILTAYVNVASPALNITTGFANTTVNFAPTLSYPTNATANSTGPYATKFPAIITYGGLSIPRPDGVVVITLNVDDIAQQNSASSRGIGKFFDLYGADASAGALMAWAWSVSRIIDALEQHPEARIDPTKIAVTGCSRNGKGAFVAGAFDERIALTLPQESGSGGDACWRISREMLVVEQEVTQTAQEIIGENVWFSTSFNTFGATNDTIGLLPVDHHELAGLVAPRGLYSTSNTDYLWLGAQSCYDCMVTGNKIYQALGVADRHGFSQDGGHAHCSFPADQVPEIQAFYDRFLFGKDADTAIVRTTGNWTYDASWAPWTVPTLN